VVLCACAPESHEPNPSPAPGPSRRISHNPKHDQDSDDESPAMMIPDLDEEQAEDITRQVAEAPSLKSSRVQTLKELDQEIDRALPPASEIGVDLSALMRFLTPGSMWDELVVAPQLCAARPPRTDPPGSWLLHAR
jgi:hypothetical protein